MDDPNVQRPKCVWGKKCRNRSEVDAWLAQYRKRKKKWEPRLHPYLCNACGWWHVTKQKQK